MIHKLRYYYDIIASEYDWKYKNPYIRYMRRVEFQLLKKYIQKGLTFSSCEKSYHIKPLEMNLCND